MFAQCTDTDNRTKLVLPGSTAATTYRTKLTHTKFRFASLLLTLHRPSTNLPTVFSYTHTPRSICTYIRVYTNPTQEQGTTALPPANLKTAAASRRSSKQRKFSNPETPKILSLAKCTAAASSSQSETVIKPSKTQEESRADSLAFPHSCLYSVQRQRLKPRRISAAREARAAAAQEGCCSRE